MKFIISMFLAGISCLFGYAEQSMPTATTHSPELLGLRLVSKSDSNRPTDIDNELTLSFTSNLVVRTLRYTGNSGSTCAGTARETYSFTTTNTDVTFLAGHSYTTTQGGNWTAANSSSNPSRWRYSASYPVRAILVELLNSSGTVLASRCVADYLSATQFPSNTTCTSSACQFYSGSTSWTVN